MIKRDDLSNQSSIIEKAMNKIIPPNPQTPNYSSNQKKKKSHFYNNPTSNSSKKTNKNPRKKEQEQKQNKEGCQKLPGVPGKFLFFLRGTSGLRLELGCC